MSNVYYTYDTVLPRLRPVINVPASTYPSEMSLTLEVSKVF